MTTESKANSAFEMFRNGAIAVLGVLMCIYTLIEVNFPHFQPLTVVVIFVMIGLVLCFLIYPAHKSLKNNRIAQCIDFVLAGLVIFCCGYIAIHSEDLFKQLWINDQSIGNRAGAITWFESILGLVGTVLVLEATRRAIGLIVPLLALVFIAHSYYCYLSREYGFPTLPSSMLPHSGQDLSVISEKAFLQSQGVFGTAAKVMFTYVFLFVVFGAFLEISGATRFIINCSKRIFGNSTAGPAQVAVIGSGLMGSLSGSAVANAMTTGAFTIPMMKNAGFDNTTAGGITAAAATGGALVPPVMGAAAYMMLEFVNPQVTFTQVASAAALPAILYYFSLWMIVHFYSRRMGTIKRDDHGQPTPVNFYEGVIFGIALGVLILLLVLGVTVAKAVTGSLVAIMLLTVFRKVLSNGTVVTSRMRTLSLVAFILGSAAYAGYCYFETDTFNVFDQQITEIRQLKDSLPDISDPDTLILKTNEHTAKQWALFNSIIIFVLDVSFIGMFAMIFEWLGDPGWRRTIITLLKKSSNNGVSLVAASACVGIIIAIIDSTGIAQDFNSVIKDYVEDYLILALIGIMISSIILGMGVPSVVCYLLMATLMGGLLQQMGVIPLSAHMFIFYFGMMSMVTPPVALAAYATASIAEANIMKTAFAAFKFALVGFTLPFMFVYRPALLLLNEGKWKAWISAVAENSPDQADLLAAAETAWPNLSNFLIAMTAAIIGIIALAAGIAGFLRQRLSIAARAMCMVAAALLLLPEIRAGERDIGVWVNLAGALLFTVILFLPGDKTRKTSEIAVETNTQTA
jgi:TRAP transporter 4TM/12TM fusion protein